jgi:hypothetical protein
METMDAIQDTLGPKMIRQKVLGILALLRDSGPEGGFEKID